LKRAKILKFPLKILVHDPSGPLMKKILIPIIIIGIAGLVIASRRTSAPQLDQPTQVSIGWVKGNQNSDIKLVEYSDFQCPACAVYYPVAKQLMQEFGDKIAFEYRHLPLKQHRNAEPAALAAEAAGMQGKFWEMHNLLFERQNEWSDQQNAGETFIKYAQAFNLDINKFKSDTDSSELKKKVRDSYENGISAGVNATPTFFLNGKKIATPRSYEEFADIIRKAL
jgi:protein-disulfide isomerase